MDREPLPLIEGGKSQRDCVDWWAARYDRPLERSPCVACPFPSRSRWIETKRRGPEMLAEALDEADMGADGQRDGFGNECEGHCGV